MPQLDGAISYKIYLNFLGQNKKRLHLKLVMKFMRAVKSFNHIRHNVYTKFQFEN